MSQQDAGPLPRWKSNSSVSDPRKALIRRRDDAVQIRKQRKEDVLRRKRGIVSTTAAVSSSSSSPTSATTETTAAVVHPENELGLLKSSLDAYLQQPNQLTDPAPLWRTLSVSHRTTVKVLLQSLLLSHSESKARALVSNLIASLQQQRDDETREAALLILLEITSVVTTSKQQQASTSDDSYYGRAPLCWSDLFLSSSTTTTTTESTLVSVLIKLLMQQLTAASIPYQQTETVLNVLGNLVQDSSSSSSSSLEFILRHWSLFTAHLPAASYCCAAILRHDQTHYGMDFLRSLTVRQISGLLLNDTTATEAAWMIEGLSRREDQAVDALLASVDTTAEEPTLLSCLIQRIHQAANANNKDFLVPALRAVCNLVTACEGRYVPVFLEQPVFVQAMNRLLDERTVLDAVTAASCLLTDAGLPGGHPATTIGTPNFVPRLVQMIVVSEQYVRLEWKREAACAISNAIYSLAAPVVELDFVQQALRDFVWATTADDERQHQHKLIQALIDLTTVPDQDAVVAALQILDRLLRSVESSRFLFESCDGVHALEKVCAGTSELEVSSQLAANLIDDLFDQDEEEEVAADFETLPLANNPFAVVGTQDQSQPPCFTFGDGSSPQPPLPTLTFGGSDDYDSTALPPAGRGRGRTMPAWMQEQQM